MAISTAYSSLLIVGGEKICVSLSPPPFLLQRVAVCCSTLLCGAVWCSVMQCGAVWCSALPCGAVWCSAVPCGAVYSNVVRCGAVWCGVVQRGAVCCSVARCGAVWCSVRLYFGDTEWFFYVVATISRLLKIIGLFCKRDSQKRPIFSKETYTFKKLTNRSQPILFYDRGGVVGQIVSHDQWIHMWHDSITIHSYVTGLYHDWFIYNSTRSCVPWLTHDSFI